MRLRHLDGGPPMNDQRDGRCNPHIGITQQQLQAIWSGEFDITDTIAVLRRESERLAALAAAIEKNDS